MAYMSQDQKKTLTPGIKGVLTKYRVKGTIAVRHHSALVVTVTEGPLDLVGNANARLEERCEPGERRPLHKGYIDVNNSHARDHFSGDCQAFVLELLEACNVGNWNRSDLQTDYHNVGWYVDIKIGRYDRPYTLVQATHAADAATAETHERVATTERDYGGAFDGFTVTSDADTGL